MTRAYVVTEGESDVELLRRLLPEAIVKDTAFVAGSGSYSAQSLATTILAVKRRPVALVVDADTEDGLLVQERLDFLRELLRQTSSGVPFEVFIAVPEMEAVLFENKSALEHLLKQQFYDREWAIAKHSPKDSLTTVLGNRVLDIEKMLDGAPDEVIGGLRKHPLLEKLGQFLASVVNGGG